MKSILIYGDSNTWGLIPGSSPAVRFPWNVRWTGRLQSLCRDVRILEEGLCGRTVSREDAVRANRNGSRTLPMLLESHAPLEAAVVMLGTNDCKACFSVPPQQIARDMQALLTLFDPFIPAQNILLIAPPFLGEDVWLPGKDPAFDKIGVQTSRILRTEYETLAQRSGTAFLAASDYVTVSCIDDEHMDADGHRRFADAVFEKLKEMRVIPSASRIGVLRSSARG